MAARLESHPDAQENCQSRGKEREVYWRIAELEGAVGAQRRGMTENT